MTDEAVRALERGIRHAVAEHRGRLDQSRDAPPGAFERRWLLASLGLPPDSLDRIAAAPQGSDLPADLRLVLQHALRREAGRLLRRARAGGAGYDLNRHIAVDRLLRWTLSPPQPKRRAPPQRAQRSVTAARRPSPGGNPAEAMRTLPKP